MSTSDKLFELCDKLEWKNKERRSNITFGEDGSVYRTTFGSHDNAKTYDRKVLSWDLFPDVDLLMCIKDKVDKLINSASNICAIMRYPNSSSVIKKHKDREMKEGTTICGISVGAKRRILFTKYYTNYNGNNDVMLELNHGSLYCMHPPTNNKWFHEILPEKESAGVRYSLTFRDMIFENDPNLINITENQPQGNITHFTYCDALLKSGKRKGERCG